MLKKLQAAFAVPALAAFLLVALLAVGSTPASANSISLGGGVATLSADTPTYSNGYAYTHSRIKDNYNTLGIPMALQSCLQANPGGAGWYSVKCYTDGKSTATEKNITQSVKVPACGWWFRTWSWGQAWWLYVTWHTDSGALTSNANYLC